MLVHISSEPIVYNSVSTSIYTVELSSVKNFFSRIFISYLPTNEIRHDIFNVTHGNYKRK